MPAKGQPSNDENPSLQYPSYHAHVYYDEDTRKAADDIRQALGSRFEVQLGRWHDVPVGPHPSAMYQVAFDADQFDRVVPWLMENHAGLSVLIHPNSGDDLGDHTEKALWLGQALPLNVEMFQK